ncbi:MAG: hypothetical protein APR63_14055 [Desulfuromonas sp. SDB]|nr:MAG: hypothetical protein APR63_14055 [Desulfuromonas sp. SDB]
MPGGDRTGPIGQGPRTGRGLGDCQGTGGNVSQWFGNLTRNFLGRGLGLGRGGGRGRGRGQGIGRGRR